MLHPEPARLAADLPSLVCRCVDGDELAWDEFVGRFHRRIVVFVTRSTKNGDADTRAEVIQEVYIRLLANDCRALRAWHGASESSWLAYLATIVHAVACDAIKRRRSLKRTAAVVSLDGGDRRDTGRLAEAIPAPESNSPERLLDERLVPERLVSLLATVERGPQASRNSLIFLLHVLDGLTASEISRLPGLELPVANVESALRRTKERLREVLGSPLSL